MHKICPEPRYLFIQHTPRKALPSASPLCTHSPTGPEKQKIQEGPCLKPQIWNCSLEDEDTAHPMSPLALSQICWTSLDKLCSSVPILREIQSRTTAVAVTQLCLTAAVI